MAFCHFHHFVNRAKRLGKQSSIWDYDLNFLCATQGKFAHIKAKDSVLDLPYAYHFDASLYAKFLRRYCEKLGVNRHEGVIETVQQHPSGDIFGVTLQSGQRIEGDLFVDCSGFRGLLIQQTLGVGFDDWSHLLPCDSAVAMPSERCDKTVPYTRAIAHKAGWQWRIPLQHRNGNGLVYCSSHLSDDEAINTLMRNLDTAPMGEPNLIKFKTGRRRKQWHKNVIAVGLASGFLEPLESTSIHLIQSAIVRLIHLFPHNGIDSAAVDEFNHQSELEYVHIKDFLVMHYYLTERNDSQFWRNMQSLEIPDSLRHKMTLFKQNGKLFREQSDIFLESSWLQVMVGQGIEPEDYHPIANNLTQTQLFNMLDKMYGVKREPLASLPSHDKFLRHFCQ
jgi:tryptophan halogenase